MQQLRVSFLAGLVAPRDAMSSICLRHLDAIASWAVSKRIHLDARVFSQSVNVPDSRVHPVTSLASLLADEHFQNSQLIVAEFGMIFGLFDALHFAPPGARKVVVYHGITPPAIMPAIAKELRDSYRQATNMLLADQIITTSRFLRSELHKIGVPSSRVAVVPPPVAITPPPVFSPKTHDPANLKIAYLGRVVESKGVADLVSAVGILKAKDKPVQLRIMTNKTMGDPAYFKRLYKLIPDLGLEDFVHFDFGLSNYEVSRTFAQSDALVIPSYHEGFGVPIIEALGCRTFVMCTDRGALPEVSGGFGRSFPAQNPHELALRLEELSDSLSRNGYTTDRGFMEFEPWNHAVAEHLQTFDPNLSDRRFVEFATRDLKIAHNDNDQFLAQLRRDAIHTIHNSPIAPIQSRQIDLQITRILESTGVTFESEPHKIPDHLATPGRVTEPDAPRSAVPSLTTVDGVERPEKTVEKIDYAAESRALLDLPTEEFIEKLYRLILKRPADAEGLKSWTQRINDGFPRIRAIERFALTSEARGVGLDVEWLTDLDDLRYPYVPPVPPDLTHDMLRVITLPDNFFVHFTYKILLGREPDGVGADQYLAKLRRGVRRLDIVREIANSDECRTHLGDPPPPWLQNLPDIEDLALKLNAVKPWHKRIRNRW